MQITKIVSMHRGILNAGLTLIHGHLLQPIFFFDRVIYVIEPISFFFMLSDR